MSLVYLSMATELAGLWQQHCLEEQGGLCAQHILAWEWVIYPQHGNPLHELCDVASTETRRSCGDALTIIVQGSFLFILWISFPFFISTYFWNIFKQGNGAGRSYFFTGYSFSNPYYLDKLSCCPWFIWYYFAKVKKKAFSSQNSHHKTIHSHIPQWAWEEQGTGMT